ncbi:rhomboid protease GluP [Oikeobacillus pervagus]|uniref:Rhomboid protease GluP n=1 Tax=Oikeobacillus pervagus TaxID=1325931 RepID=A0AAJ1WHQ8_9BACI|nr:rhomboid family intramembrane serine protease [Oikeobacillus pervagus]MDQ0213870.1 rhomboid protease GluP [Oikeobacillus pervagus]
MDRDSNMGFREEYIFWRTAYFFIVEHGYRIAKMSENRKELWLEDLTNKQAHLIRLLQHDLDWSNSMQRDIEFVSLNGEQIRKRLMKREMKILNIYVSTYPPVDDYESRIKEPFVFPKGNKTIVSTIILSEPLMDDSFTQLSNIFQTPIHWQFQQEYEEQEVSTLQRVVLGNAVQQQDQDKRLMTFGKPFFTYILVAIQVIMFAILEFSGGSTNTETLIKFGAKYNPAILEGEWWRFFTPMVLHIGFLHLLMNTLALYYLGAEVERIFGKGRFLFIYIFSGFLGSVASFVFTANLSAGASGAIFGCFGALLYFGVMYPKLFFRTMGMNIIAVIVINLIFGFTVPGIDNAGHIGGLIGGFLATGVVHFPKKRRWKNQTAFTIVTMGLTILFLGIGFNNGFAKMNPNMVNSVAQQKIQEKQYDEAYEILTDYMSENGKESAESYFLLSYIEIQHKEYQQAEVHLNQAIELRGDFPEAHYNLSLLLSDKGEVEEALKHAKTALRLDPQNDQYKKIVDELTR